MRAAEIGDVGEIVQVVPPFSGHRQGILREIGTHESGMSTHGIDFGEGRVESLIDWKVYVLEDEETYETAFPQPAAKSPISKPKSAKQPKAAKAPATPKAPAGPPVRDADGNLPPGWRESVLGSGKPTKSFFYPGEDATAKSWLLKVRRGEKRRSELPQQLVDFVNTNEKWNGLFADVIALTDEHYEATQRAKTEIQNSTTPQPLPE